MAPDNTEKLEELRKKTLDKLASMSDELASNDAIGVDALLTVARTTGKTELLDKALTKVDSIEDSSEKADALLDILGEVETQLTEQSEPETQDGDSSTPEETSSEEKDSFPQS